MDRIIKFRIWDKAKNKYNTWSDYDENDPHDLIEYYDHPAACFLNALRDTIKDEDFIIQQFTGLLDIDNKEIFEGDIVKINPDTTPRLVKWDNLELKWGLEYTDFPNFCERLSDFKGNIEVVGNIFENPNLLKNN